MCKHVWASVVLLLVALSVKPGVASAEPMNLPGETVNAIQAFAEATQQLNKAKGAMAALEAGEKPHGSPEEWNGVVVGYQRATEALRRSAGPALPDVSGYGVPVEQLRGCSTRAAALAKLDKQLKAIHGLSQQVSDTKTFLKNRLDTAQAADESRQYLVKAAAKLAGSPALAETFPWSWKDLDGPVAKAIAAYTKELKQYQDRMDRGANQLKAWAAAASRQIESFGSAKDCLLAGHWSGSKSQSGVVAGLTLHLIASGASWNGTADVDGKTIAIRNVAISGNTLSVALADGRGSMRGTLSVDGRNYRGSFSSMDGPGSFALTKQ